jgi:hypothetical protein
MLAVACMVALLCVTVGHPLAETQGWCELSEPSIAVQYSYKVSAAHHGFGPPDPNYNDGIWNDFSDISALVETVDNIYDVDIAFDGTELDSDSLIVCPSGDGESLGVILTVHGSDSSPTVGIPSDEVLFFLSRPSLAACSADPFVVGTCEGDTLQAARETDSNGTTELVYSAIKGCGTIDVTAQVMGKPAFDTLTVLVRSPDIDGNGFVSFLDLSLFASAYNSNCGDTAYCSCVDFNLDCHVNLVDLSILASHYCPSNCPVHKCGSGSGSMVVNAWSAPGGEVSEGVTAIKPTFDIGSAKERRLEDGRISIPVTLKRVSSLLACHVVIRYEGTVTSAEFLATDYMHDPVVIPARVDDTKKTVMVALAASGGVVTRSAEGIL